MIYEQRLLSIPEAYLYKVPPLKQAVGHRAESWGLANPMLTGKIDLIGKADTLEIRILDDNDTVVARCPVRCAPGSPAIEAIVDAVVDSSRYFVLRCEDEKRRRAFVGVGFRERETAYDFKATIFDFKAKIDRQIKAENKQKELTEAKESKKVDNREDEPEVEDKNLSLNAPIKLSLGSGSEDDAKTASTKSLSSGPILKLAPPPARLSMGKALSVIAVSKQEPPTPVANDDDFGDFESADFADFESATPQHEADAERS